MAKRKDPIERREQKRQVLIERSAAIMGIRDEDAAGRLTIPLVQCVRVNPLQGDTEKIVTEMKQVGWDGTRHEWYKDGYTIASGYEALRDSALVTEGKIYIQNPSSWLPVIALDPKRGDRILDICAAPGGKTSHIAALQENSGEIIANDNSRARLLRLQANLTRLGTNAECTLYDATRLTKYIEPESFDKILLDAPCSGEGLINLDNPKSLDTWSVAHIRRLSELQKKLITQAWQLLKPGGTLVYSTCTMAPEENETVIDYLLRRYEDARTIELPFELSKPVTAWNDRQYNAQIQKAARVFPENGYEAFFVCTAQKKLISDKE